MKDRLGREGLIKGLLLLLIIVALVFVGFSFAKPYYRYNTLRSHTKDILMLQLGNIPEIRKEIMKEADKLGISLAEQNLKVVQIMKEIRVTAEWTDVVDFWGYYQKELDFKMKVEY